MKSNSRVLIPLLLLTALGVTSCQLPVGGQTGRIEVRNPYLQGTQRKAGDPLVAFPQNVLASLDHYVLKVLTTGGDAIPSIPDQTLAPASPVFAVDLVAVGSYLLVVEAWSAGPVKTAESSQVIVVTAGTVTTIDTLVLTPLATGGDGTFNFSVGITTGFGSLATAGKLSATLAQLNYSLGSLDGVPTLVNQSLFSFVPSASSLDFASTSPLAAGNYLITLARESTSLDAPAPVPVTGLLVQVFPGQESTLAAASIPDAWLDAPPDTAPQNVQVEMDTLGNTFISWDAPGNHMATAYYQVGYSSVKTDVVPTAALSLVSGSGDKVEGVELERTGSRLRVKVTPGTPPFDAPGGAEVVVFVRSVAGQFSASSWTAATFTPSLLVRPRPIASLVFWDLKPGSWYELQKRAPNSSVLASYEFTTGASDPTAEPPPQTYTFPGLTVNPGESLVLSLHQPDGTVTDMPMALDVLPFEDPSNTYGLAPYYVHKATRDPEGSPSDTWILLTDPSNGTLGDRALDPAPTVTLTTPEGTTIVGWTGTELGLPHYSRSGWSLETDSPANPGRLILPSGNTEYPTFGNWAPVDGKVTHYRMRAVYGPITYNGQVFEILGPPSAWAAFDLHPPTVVVDSWGTFASVASLSTVFRYTDNQTHNDVPAYLTVILRSWSGGDVATSTLADGSFVTVNGVTTWTPPASWLAEGAITIDTSESYQLIIVAEDASGNETSVGTALKGGQ